MMHPFSTQVDAHSYLSNFRRSVCKSILSKSAYFDTCADARVVETLGNQLQPVNLKLAQELYHPDKSWPGLFFCEFGRCCVYETTYDNMDEMIGEVTESARACSYFLS